jgi:hypothetical protein
LILPQLRPGEGSSKMIEVDAFYSPHLQQHPQVPFYVAPLDNFTHAAAECFLRLESIMLANF